MWRDQILSRWQHTDAAAWRTEKTPGEDFFYVQEVRFFLSLSFLDITPRVSLFFFLSIS
jgi:hypothetical protein